MIDTEIIHRKYGNSLFVNFFGVMCQIWPTPTFDWILYWRLLLLWGLQGRLGTSKTYNFVKEEDFDVSRTTQTQGIVSKSFIENYDFFFIILRLENWYHFEWIYNADFKDLLGKSISRTSQKVAEKVLLRFVITTFYDLNYKSPSKV